MPKKNEIEALNLKCVPGRTVIEIVEKTEPKEVNSDEDEGSIAGDTTKLRSHMNTGMKDEYCKVCVCSVEGLDEYCSERPAMNVNECLKMVKIMNDLQTSVPFDHTRNLAYRIRRDYIWHNDEIPYKAKAKCKRSHSYYSNSITAMDTDIDLASDVESLLDYSNKTVCFYCVCASDASSAGCISRLPWFCEYYRKLRDNDAARDRYRDLFQQDRPTYFRQLSWRLRRTMDNGMYDFVETVGGDEKSPEAGTKCIPYVSEYSDCTDDNRCSGCTKCVCVGDDSWSCSSVSECPGDEFRDASRDVNEESLDSVFYGIQNELEQQEARSPKSQTSYVPAPLEDKDLLLGFGEEGQLLDDRIRTMLRNKRSVDQVNDTSDGVKFHNTVDELNEDTLKNGNLSGTLHAQKVNALPTPLKGSRRTGLLKTDNLSQTSLNIEHNQQTAYDDHLTDNKIDAAVHTDQYNGINDDIINKIMGNHTQKQKDKNLSKLIVNELKSGTEFIGDKNAPIMSNITFTPENDTLTAMAFIAGNLLNKLWNMEKGSGENSRETEALKHEKIADLLDLFKEPLNLRQENFLKNALEQLSHAIDKDKTLNNTSLCETIAGNIENIDNNYTGQDESNKKLYSNKENDTETRKTLKKEEPVKVETISKINNVLKLISKFQNLQKNINTLKNTTSKVERKPSKNTASANENLTNDESEWLNMFGNILEKITKLLMPPKKAKKLVKSIKNQNVFKTDIEFAKQIKNTYNLDLNGSSLTVKDKILIDYLNTVKNNPKCLLENLKPENTKSVSSVVGDILLNLSKFFKINSYMDFIKLLGPESKSNVQTDVISTTPEVSRTSTIVPTTETLATTELSNKLLKTKEKLKSHLMTIIDDLIELQNANGQSTNNISIVEALPCIFKILNADNNIPKKMYNKDKAKTQAAKVAAIFDSLKKDLKSAQNRRTNIITEHRPKSAVVWERIVKNYDEKKTKTRRHMEVKEPKTFDEIKTQMDEIESTSKTYKSVALTNGVPPSERQIVLKTLLEDIRQYIHVMEDIKNSLNNLDHISIEKKNDLEEFITNAASNINLDKKIAKSINVLKSNRNLAQSVLNKNNKMPKMNNNQHQSMKMLDASGTKNNNIKLSRDAIINQLIKNRMQLYVKIKESNGVDLAEDINYSIAKKILVYLETGNNSLARELYKALITTKQKTEDVNKFSVTPAMKKPATLRKEPLVQFEEPQRKVQWLSQEAWLKQLINLKNMRS